MLKETVSEEQYLLHLLCTLQPSQESYISHASITHTNTLTRIRQVNTKHVITTASIMVYHNNSDNIDIYSYSVSIQLKIIHKVLFGTQCHMLDHVSHCQDNQMVLQCYWLECYCLGNNY